MSATLESILAQTRAAGATLIAVSKTQPVARIRTLYEQGVRDFGENRVQELLSKAPLLPEDIRWHLIGHLQTNKVRQIAPFIHLIHSVDSLRLLQEIEKQAALCQRNIGILFQYHVAREETKYGIDPREDGWLENLDFPGQFPHLEPRGIMGMASFTDDQDQVRAEFRQLQHLFNKLKAGPLGQQASFRERSMGMSGDYLLALEEGSTMIRVGSLLFPEEPSATS